MVTLRPEEEEIVRLLEKNPRGLCIREIAKKLDICEGTASKRVAILSRLREIDERRVGRAKLFYPKTTRRHGFYKEERF